MRSSVDLPEPEGPMSATISPGATSSETESSAATPRQVLETARMSRATGAGWMSSAMVAFMPACGPGWNFRGPHRLDFETVRTTVS